MLLLASPESPAHWWQSQNPSLRVSNCYSLAPASTCGCLLCATTPRARGAPAQIGLPSRPFCAIIPFPSPILTGRWLEVNHESLGRISLRDTTNPSSPDRSLSAHFSAAPLPACRASAPRARGRQPNPARARGLLTCAAQQCERARRSPRRAAASSRHRPLHRQAAHSCASGSKSSLARRKIRCRFCGR